MDVHRRSRKTEPACRLPLAFSAQAVGTRDGGKLGNTQTEKFTSPLAGKLAPYVSASVQVELRARGLNPPTTSECSVALTPAPDCAWASAFTCLGLSSHTYKMTKNEPQDILDFQGPLHGIDCSQTPQVGRGPGQSSRAFAECLHGSPCCHVAAPALACVCPIHFPVPR